MYAYCSSINASIPRAIRIKFQYDHSWLFRQSLEKNWPLSRSYFGSLEHALVTVAVVERFKQQPMYGLSNGTKESGLCREVAVCWGSTVSLEWRQSWLGFDFIWSIIKDPLKYRANENTKQRKFLKLNTVITWTCYVYHVWKEGIFFLLRSMPLDRSIGLVAFDVDGTLCK